MGGRRACRPPFFMPFGEYAGCVAQDIFHVLSDPTRRQLVELLAGSDELSVSDLVASVEASQPTVSKHLKVLRDGGVVETRADGQRRLYSLVPDALVDALEWVAQVHDAAATDDKTAVEQAEVEQAEDVPEDAAHRIVQNVGRQIESVTEKAQTFFQRFGRRK